jgi:DNA-binding NarL/FixJ family response regulator
MKTHRRGERGGLTVLLADDHSLLRSAARSYLAAALPGRRIRVAGTGADAIRRARILRPGLALLDAHLPGLSIAPLVRRIRKASPGTRIIVWSVEEDESLARAAFAAGAAAFILKDAPPATLLKLLAAPAATPQPARTVAVRRPRAKAASGA